MIQVKFLVQSYLRRSKSLFPREFATGRRLGRRPPISRGGVPAPPPANISVVDKDPWSEVRDPASGQIYWWNKETNETTALGAPKPTDLAAPQQPQGSMMGSLGRTVAEGFSFGVGSSIARSVVGSMFGGGSSSDDPIMGGGDAGGSDDDEEFL